MKNLLSLFFVFLLIPSLSIKAEEGIELIYQKLASLEQEIETLRNLIEENTYLIQRYQELQQQRYIDLDARLHEVVTREMEALNENTLTEESVNGSGELSEEISLYQNALELFDSARYSEALEAFREQIISFPEGRYSVDAYFWSGELFLAQKLLEDARENYLVVIGKFPEHERAPDALYKLGLIARNLDQEDDAVIYFLRILEEYPDTGAGQLAKKLLETSNQKSN